MLVKSENAKPDESSFITLQQFIKTAPPLIKVKCQFRLCSNMDSPHLPASMLS